MISVMTLASSGCGLRLHQYPRHNPLQAADRFTGQVDCRAPKFQRRDRVWHGALPSAGMISIGYANSSPRREKAKCCAVGHGLRTSERCGVGHGFRTVSTLAAVWQKGIAVFEVQLRKRLFAI